MSSQLNVDTIVDKAGSGGSNVKMANTSTYVSDGGAVTQNTVQGLAKAWVQVVLGGASLADSFNISGITDDGTGVHTLAINNNMANDDYAVPSSTGGSNTFGTIDSYATGTYRTVQKDTSNQAVEDILTVNTVHGDLA